MLMVQICGVHDQIQNFQIIVEVKFILIREKKKEQADKGTKHCT
jgi:hypothetical protein